MFADDMTSHVELLLHNHSLGLGGELPVSGLDPVLLHGQRPGHLHDHQAVIKASAD